MYLYPSNPLATRHCPHHTLLKIPYTLPHTCRIIIPLQFSGHPPILIVKSTLLKRHHEKKKKVQNLVCTGWFGTRLGCATHINEASLSGAEFLHYILNNEYICTRNSLPTILLAGSAAASINGLLQQFQQFPEVLREELSILDEWIVNFNATGGLARLPSGKVTLLAPTNEAFENLYTLVGGVPADDLMEALIEYHILPGEVFAFAKLMNRPFNYTLLFTLLMRLTLQF